MSDAAATLEFDPCQPLVLALDASATAEQEAGARAAVAAWSAVAPVSTTLASGAGEAPRLPLHFRAAAAPSHGVFDPALGQVLVNDDLVARALEVTIAHELGHAFGLVHVTNRASVMNPGNLDVAPNAADAAALTEAWGACPAAAGAPAP